MRVLQLLLTLVLILGFSGQVQADIDGYLNRLNLHAAADLGDFRVGLGAHFGASGSDVDLVLRSVRNPGDAALCFWLRQHSRQPLAVVLENYRQQQGWGNLAKSLGIKPGSAEFHALKAGELGWYPAGGDEAQGRKSGKSHDKGKNKNK